MGKWKEGRMSKEIRSVGGCMLSKGQKVKYARIKTIPDADGMKLTEYEYHYVAKDRSCMVRTTSLTIEGRPEIKEKYLY